MTDKQAEKQVTQKIASKTGDINCDAAVIGCGPAGQLAALELASHGLKTLLIGPQNKGQNTRTTALMMPSIAFLERHNLWNAEKMEAAPLRVMRIIDGTNRLIRSPAVEFPASEIGEYAFAYNLPNTALNAALAEAVAACSNIQRMECLAESYHLFADQAEIILSDGRAVKTQLIAAADGRNSLARQTAGIGVHRWSYPQTALTLTFSHEFPHNFISTEFHTETGPFTQVPLIGNRSALIWTMCPDKAGKILGLGKKALGQKIEARMASLLGKAEIETMPEAWPMGGMIAKSFADKRVVILGESAHLFPPIGAQGLNLTIRDVEALGEAVSLNLTDCGSGIVLNRYNKHRRLDILLRTGFVHGLNRALLSNFLPVQFIRSAGLELLREHSMLRNLFMREGMRPGAGIKSFLPSFMKS